MKPFYTCIILSTPHEVNFRSQTASHKTDIKRCAKSLSLLMLVLSSQKVFVGRTMARASVFFLENGQSWKYFENSLMMTGTDNFFFVMGASLKQTNPSPKKKERCY